MTCLPGEARAADLADVGLGDRSGQCSATDGHVLAGWGESGQIGLGEWLAGAGSADDGAGSGDAGIGVHGDDGEIGLVRLGYMLDRAQKIGKEMKFGRINP